MLKSSKDLIALPSAPPEILESYSAADEEISQAITRAQENLLRQQKADVHGQQALSRATGPVSLEIFAGHPCGDGAPAKLGTVSHLQNVVVESRDAHAAGDHQPFQADSHFTWRKAIA